MFSIFAVLPLRAAFPPALGGVSDPVLDCCCLATWGLRLHLLRGSLFPHARGAARTIFSEIMCHLQNSSKSSMGHFGAGLFAQLVASRAASSPSARTVRLIITLSVLHIT